VLVKQYSYTGLKAIADDNGGQSDRAALFRQIKSSCSQPGQTPSIWFCIVGVNDFKHIRHQEVIARSAHIFHRFLAFFENLRRFSPGSRVVWLSVGNARSWEPAFDNLRAFSSYLLHPHTTFPSWLLFRDIAADCSDMNVKDRFGHWKNGYVKEIAHRVLRTITTKVLPPTPKPGNFPSTSCKIYYRYR
jgi:hypothetical protein